MKFIKYSLMALLTLLLLTSFVSASNINGWGSDNFFGYEQQNLLFNVDINISNPIYNDSIAFGGNQKAVVCNIDRTNTENELILYSGTHVKMYSGRNNEMAEVATYISSGTITSLACLGETLYIGNDDRLEVVDFDETSLTWDVSADLETVRDISCSYTLDKCVVMFNNGFSVFDGDGSYVSGKGWTDSGLNLSGSVSFGYEDETLLLTTEETTTKYNASYDANPKQLDFINESGSGLNYHRTHFVDFNDDGIFEHCSAWVDTNTDDAIIKCYDSNFDLINDGVAAMGTTQYGLQSFVVNPTGSQIEIGIKYKYLSGSVARRVKLYNPTSDVMGSAYEYVSTFESMQNDITFGYFDLNGDWNFLIGASVQDDFFNGDITDINFDDGDIYPIVADLNGDTKGEIIFVGASETLILFDVAVDTGSLPAEITFASNTIDGGFYGYYPDETCPDTTITFEALECVGDLEDCNYYNVDTNEQERLKTDCGLGGTYYYGDYDYTNPSISCTYPTEGTYEVTIFIQDTNLLNTTNNDNVPITVTVADTALCNGANTLINQPYQTDTNTEDGGEGTAPDNDPTQEEDEEDEEASATASGSGVANRILDNIFLIIAFGIIIGVNVSLAISKVKHPIVYLISTVLITIVCNIMGLMSFMVTVFIIIAMLVISLVVGFLFKGTGAP